MRCNIELRTFEALKFNQHLNKVSVFSQREDFSRFDLKKEDTFSNIQLSYKLWRNFLCFIWSTLMSVQLWENCTHIFLWESLLLSRLGNKIYPTLMTTYYLCELLFLYCIQPTTAIYYCNIWLSHKQHVYCIICIWAACILETLCRKKQDIEKKKGQRAVG